MAVEGIGTLKTIVIGVFIAAMIVGGFTLMLTDLSSSDKYATNLNAEDNYTQSLELLRDKMNDTLDISSAVAQGVESNQTDSSLNPLDALGQQGVTAVKFTLSSFGIASAMINEIAYNVPFIPKFMITIMIGMLLFIISIAMLVVFMTLVKR